MDNTKYFFRKVVYVKKDGKAALVTNFEPIKTSPLEPWMSLIFLMADGMHTIEQLHQHLLKQYGPDVPNDYLKTVDSVFNRLLESKVVGLSDAKMQLPPYLTSAFDTQDTKESMKSMLEDGYLEAKIE